MTVGKTTRLRLSPRVLALVPKGERASWESTIMPEGENSGISGSSEDLPKNQEAVLLIDNSYCLLVKYFLA